MITALHINHFFVLQIYQYTFWGKISAETTVD